MPIDTAAGKLDLTGLPKHTMHTSLIPFTPCAWVSAIDVEFSLSGDEILCAWALGGNTNSILWPARTDNPKRVMGLWQNTCFEFFIGPAAATHYYEFNLSPGGDWNTFSFSDVREDMQETRDLVCEHSQFTLTQDEAYLEARLRFCSAATDDLFRVGVATILEHKQDAGHTSAGRTSAGRTSAGHTSAGRTSAGHTFFALNHPGVRPDFHRRDGHTLIVRRAS